jgi:twitching motility protein PilT
MWAGPAEVENFLAQVGQADPQDMLALLQILLDRRAAVDARSHSIRCAVFQRLGDQVRHRELFSHYLRAIRGADPVLRKVLVDVAQKCNNVAFHGELVALFRDADPAVRQAAAALAARVGGKTMFGQLVDLCGRPDFPGRAEAIEALVALAGYHAIPALHSTLRVGTSEEKLQALQHLGNAEMVAKNRAGALEAMVLVLEDPLEQVRHEAIAAFGRVAEEEEFIVHVGSRLGKLPVTSVCAALRAMGRFTSLRAIGVLREQFGYGPRSVRLAVLEVLETIATDDVLPLLAEALNHKQLVVRLKGAEVLQNLSRAGRLDVARTSLWLLRSRDVEVKRIAADVARKVGDAEGRLWPQLLRFLRDEDWWVRERITDALVEMAGTQLTRHVVSFLSDESDVVRRYAIEMLMRLNDPAALGALVRAATGDPDWWVRERAVEAIGKLKDPRAIPYIADLMSREPELRLTGIMAFVEIGDHSATPILAGLLETDEKDLLLASLQALEKLHDGSEIPVVLELVHHTEYKIRTLALELVERWNMAAHLRDSSMTVVKSLSTLDRLLYATVKAGGDDLMLTAGHKPYIKRMGEMIPLANNVLSNEQVEALLLPQLTEQQKESLGQLRDVDFSHEVRSEGLRFRVNVFKAAGGLSAVFRVVKNEILAMESLGLPEVVTKFGDLKNGLVLVGGPTGSGKSTTLAAIIDYINRTQPRHIVTLEDPIEVIHPPKAAMVNQREIGSHSHSFANALRATLREDPDVILVGEMRDLTTIQFAITAAETGHLVFGTVHTASADTSVDRMINAFPAGQQPQVRSILSNSLRAVACQYLIPRRDASGRALALEVMLNNDAVANLIRKGKTYQIPNIVATSREIGMQSMDYELVRLFKSGMISSEEGYMRAVNKKDFEAVVAEFETGTRPPAATGTGPAVAPTASTTGAGAPPSTRS